MRRERPARPRRSPRARSRPPESCRRTAPAGRPPSAPARTPADQFHARHRPARRGRTAGTRWGVGQRFRPRRHTSTMRTRPRTAAPGPAPARCRRRRRRPRRCARPRAQFCLQRGKPLQEVADRLDRHAAAGRHRRLAADIDRQQVERHVGASGDRDRARSARSMAVASARISRAPAAAASGARSMCACSKL